MSNHESDRKLVESFIGKAITKITFSDSRFFKGDTWNEIVITFSDNSKLEISACMDSPYSDPTPELYFEKK